MSQRHRQYCRPWMHKVFKDSHIENKADGRSWRVITLTCIKCPWEKTTRRTIRKKG